MQVFLFYVCLNCCLQLKFTVTHVVLLQQETMKYWENPTIEGDSLHPQNKSSQDCIASVHLLFWSKELMTPFTFFNWIFRGTTPPLENQTYQAHKPICFLSFHILPHHHPRHTSLCYSKNFCSLQNRDDSPFHLLSEFIPSNILQ